jgi:subfamily B ATP-binding cassette protein MsbA
MQQRLRSLLTYARPYRNIFFVGFVAAVIDSVLDGFTFALLIPFFRALFGWGPLPEAPTAIEQVLSGLVRRVAAADPHAALRGVGLCILAAVILKNAFGYLANYISAYVQECVVRDLRIAVYDHTQRMGLGFFRRVKGGQLLSRMLADADNIKFAVGQGLASALQSLALVVTYAVILCFINWRLALVAALFAPAGALLVRPLIHGVRRHQRAAMHERGELTAVVSETLSGARVVKVHGAERVERTRVGSAIGAVTKAVLRAQRSAILAPSLSEPLGAACVVILVFLGTSSLAGTPLRPELFLAFLAVAVRLLPPIKQLSQFPPQMEQALTAAERMFEILDLPADDVDPPGARPFPGLKDAITFDDVWFAYEPDTWVLRGVNLRVAQGEVVALVGVSGAGKSTLVDLLPRFIEPGRGAVRVDGVPIDRYSRASLRAAIGFVGQETFLFHDTVRANIAYGDQAGASATAIEAAARAANAHDFIARLPQGYDTVIGERGTRLSGGERQRLALARVLLRDPPILILDEATSALDAESERLVQEAIARLLVNRTVLLIAHRLSTVAGAHRIAVLDHGRIVEVGSHDELVEAGGLYQRLHTPNVSAAD